MNALSFKIYDEDDNKDFIAIGKCGQRYLTIENISDSNIKINSDGFRIEFRPGILANDAITNDAITNDALTDASGKSYKLIKEKSENKIQISASNNTIPLAKGEKLTFNLADLNIAATSTQVTRVLLKYKLTNDSEEETVLYPLLILKDKPSQHISALSVKILGETTTFPNPNPKTPETKRNYKRLVLQVKANPGLSQAIELNSESQFYLEGEQISSARIWFLNKGRQNTLVDTGYPKDLSKDNNQFKVEVNENSESYQPDKVVCTIEVVLHTALAVKHEKFNDNDAVGVGRYYLGGDLVLRYVNIKGAAMGHVVIPLENPDITPRGMINMWSGSIKDIPWGWALCDGKDTTPDLRDQFIVGAGNNYDIGEEGGKDKVTLTEQQMPKHQHHVSGKTDNDGKHQHQWDGYNKVGDGKKEVRSRKRITSDPWDYEIPHGSEHVHNINFWSKSTGGSQPFDNRPPYYALAFIMKL